MTPARPDVKPWQGPDPFVRPWQASRRPVPAVPASCPAPCC